jgi:integrase
VATRRSKYDGIFHADGRWTTFVELAHGADGKRKRKKIAHADKDEVVRLRDEARAALQKGGTLPSAHTTVDDAVHGWIAGRRKVSKATKANYESVAQNHIYGTAIGGRRLTALDVDDVNRHLDWKEQTLAPSTVRLIRVILHGAIKAAQVRGEVPRNVVEETEPPNLGDPKHHAFTVEERDAILKASAETRYSALFRIMLLLGLRPGEALGLQWRDVDLEGRTLTVRHALKRDGTLGDTKNKSSRRTLRLPASVIPVLVTRRSLQSDEKKRAREYWRNPDGLIFTTKYGSAVSDRNLAQQDWADICDEAGVGKRDLHECRHTFALIALVVAKIPVEQVSRILGHSSVRVTVDVYAADLPLHLDDAIDAVDATVAV